MKGTRKLARVLKDHLLLLSALLAMIFLLLEVSDATPLANAREIFGTVFCGAWLTVFGYAQISK